TDAWKYSAAGVGHHAANGPNVRLRRDSGNCHHEEHNGDQTGERSVRMRLHGEPPASRIGKAVPVASGMFPWGIWLDTPTSAGGWIHSAEDGFARHGNKRVIVHDSPTR